MFELDRHDVTQVLACQRTEPDDVVNAIDELGPEERRRITLQIGGHDQHAVREVDGAALPIGQATIVEYLEEHVKDVRVGFLDLVEQHHGVRSTAHGLCQLTALVVADVSGRGTNQPADRVLFHVLAHVDPDHCPFVVKQELG